MTEEKEVTRDSIGSELVREDESFAEIVRQFVDGLGDRIQAMENAVGTADFEALRVSAHQLKGCGGGYGYPILTQRAAVLERLAISRASGECAAAVEELKRIAARVVVDDRSQPG